MLIRYVARLVKAAKFAALGVDVTRQTEQPPVRYSERVTFSPIQLAAWGAAPPTIGTAGGSWSPLPN